MQPLSCTVEPDDRAGVVSPSPSTRVEFSAQINYRLVPFLGATAALGGLLFGFDIASTTGAGTFLKRHFGLADLALVAACLLNRFSGLLVLVLILAYIAFFAACIGPVFWTLVPEIFLNRVRGTAMTVVGLTQWAANAIVVLLFPVLQELPGEFSLGLFEGRTGLHQTR